MNYLGHDESSNLHSFSCCFPQTNTHDTTPSAPGDPLIDGVHQRIINLTAVPKSHAEPWAVGSSHSLCYLTQKMSG